MKLFHVSDVHFGAEDPAALAWFAACVENERPDAVIMTGDLTMRARAGEFARGAAWLTGLGVPVTAEIGNHDIPYYWNPLGRLLSPFARYRGMKAAVERPLDLPGLRVVPLSTIARAQWRVNQSQGHVGRAALADALTGVRAAARDDVVLVAAHHPLIGPGAPASDSTTGGRAALSALAEAGAHAVLTGHVHVPFDRIVDLAGGRIRLIGAGTLSRRLRGHPASFNELRIHAGARLTMLVRTLDNDG